MAEKVYDTADYRILSDAGGKRYRFYCAISKMSIFVTEPIEAGSPEEELTAAWSNEARSCFNKCTRCGRWVSDLMYNVDTGQCVDCTPWEEKANYCPKCGTRVSSGGAFCTRCGTELLYGEVSDS